MCCLDDEESSIWAKLHSLTSCPVLAEIGYMILTGKKKKIPKEYFTNEIHYDIFKSLKRPTTLIFSENYLVLVFYHRANTYYLLGINSDSKVFINKMLHAPDFTKVAVSVWNEKLRWAFTIGKTDDYHIRNKLDYHYEPEQILGRYGTYRLQGDLTLTLIDSKDPYQDFLNEIANNIFWQVARVIHLRILERIRDVLLEHGITSEIVRVNSPEGFHLRIPGVSPRYDSGKLIRKLIEKELYVSDIIPKEELHVETSLYGLYGSPYYNLIINVHIFNWIDFITRFARKLVNDIDFQETLISFKAGRHHISYCGYPSRFTLSVKLPFNNEESETLFTVNTDLRFFKGGKTLKIHHPEHGLSIFNIPRDSIGIFSNVAVHTDFNAQLNLHAIKLLSATL